MLKSEMEQRKREQFDEVIREFQDCGFVAYLSSVSTGFVQYAPAKFFPRVEDCASGLASADAVFLACLYIPDKEARGKGLETTMLENLIAEFTGREFEAIETFARKSSQDNLSGSLELYLKHGFKTKNDRNDFPLVRLKL